MAIQFQDKNIQSPTSGFLAAFFITVLMAGLAYLSYSYLTTNFYMTVLFGFLSMCCLFLYSGLKTIEPGEALLITFFGKYVGTVKDSGFYWFNIFYSSSISTIKQINGVTEVLKINDASGSPIEVAATVSYNVVDVSKSFFAVENRANFIKNQCEASLRQVISKYRYESEDIEEITLRSNSQDVSEELRNTLSNDLKVAGILIQSAKISHLAYAPEIASAMLRRQQAEAVISARKKIVEGAVTMVEMAIKEIEERKIAVISPEQRTQLVTNLMTVLVSEDKAQPVLNLK